MTKERNILEKLSEWELDEMAMLRRSGRTWAALAELYGVSERTAQRLHAQWIERRVVSA